MNTSDWRARAQKEIDNKTKPLGALGQLEALSIQLSCIQQTLTPRVYPAQVLVFGGDHGVTKQGVSAYPSEVTGQMMANFSTGGAAINVISQSVGASLKVIDVGVDSDLSGIENIEHRKIDFGTQDFTQSAAMTVEQCQQAIDIGACQVEIAFTKGIKTIALGEMGIGNTTSAAAIICAFTNLPVEQIVGRGTGISDDSLVHKCDIVSKGLKLHHSSTQQPISILAALGGFEVAAITGAILKATDLGLNIVIDGFISTAAAITACNMNPASRDYQFFSHQSAEKGHQLALKYLKAQPILQLGLRLGEGTGAALCLPILSAAAAILKDMATFEQAGVSGQ